MCTHAYHHYHDYMYFHVGVLTMIINGSMFFCTYRLMLLQQKNQVLKLLFSMNVAICLLFILMAIVTIATCTLYKGMQYFYLSYGVGLNCVLGDLHSPIVISTYI